MNLLRGGILIAVIAGCGTTAFAQGAITVPCETAVEPCFPVSLSKRPAPRSSNASAPLSPTHKGNTRLSTCGRHL
jgi:hypothetical protein